MALTYTPPSDPRKSLPSFSLLGLDDKTYSGSDFKEKALLIMFICNHCPYVRQLEDRILKLVDFFKDENVKFVGICSNDPKTYPEDATENLKKRYKEKNYNFLYLVDDKAQVARLFEAVCTPDFFLYNQDRKQIWRGRLDDCADSEKEVTKEEMKEAIKKVLQNKTPEIEKPSCGCSIKWPS